jgi:hypothetical protein
MNTRVLTSWLMIICPIGMMVMFAGLEPLIMGAAGEGLGPNERVLAGLETFNDKKVAGYFISIFGLLFMVGMISALALLGKSLKGTGAAIGTLSSLIFTAILTIPVVGMGLTLSATQIFADGYTDVAVSLELISDSAFMGMPVFWGLGLILLGLGMLLEKRPLPTVLSGLLCLIGLVMFPAALILDDVGFLVFAISILLVVVSGVFLLRQQD